MITQLLNANASFFPMFQGYTNPELIYKSIIGDKTAPKLWVEYIGNLFRNDVLVSKR